MNQLCVSCTVYDAARIFAADDGAVLSRITGTRHGELETDLLCVPVQTASSYCTTTTAGANGTEVTKAVDKDLPC